MSLEHIYVEIDEANKKLRSLRREMNKNSCESGYYKNQIEIGKVYRKGLKKAISLLNKER